MQEPGRAPALGDGGYHLTRPLAESGATAGQRLGAPARCSVRPARRQPHRCRQPTRRRTGSDQHRQQHSLDRHRRTRPAGTSHTIFLIPISTGGAASLSPPIGSLSRQRQHLHGHRRPSRAPPPRSSTARKTPVQGGAKKAICNARATSQPACASGAPVSSPLRSRSPPASFRIAPVRRCRRLGCAGGRTGSVAGPNPGFVWSRRHPDAEQRYGRITRGGSEPGHELPASGSHS